MALGLLSLATGSCDGPTNPPPNNQTADTGSGKGSATAPHAPVPSAAAANTQPAATDSTSKPGKPATPSYPSLPGAVTKAPDWAVTNAPFDIAAYFTAPADNAAPLYLDALFEFGPDDMKDCLAPAEVERRGPPAKLRLLQAEAFIDSFKSDPKSVPPASIDAVVSGYEPALKMLTAAQERKACLFGLGIGHLTPLPHLNAARTAANIILMQINRELHRGDIDRAISEVEMLLRFSRDVRSCGGAVGGLVSISIDLRIDRNVIPEILADPDLTKDRCDRMLRALAKHEADSDLVRGIFQGEYVLLRSLLRPEVRDFLLEVAKQPKLNDMFQGADAETFTKLADLAAHLTPADFDAQLEAINQWYKSMLDLSQQPRQQRSEAAIRSIDEEAMRSRSPHLSGINPFLATFFPNDNALYMAVDRGRTFHRGAQCLIALRRWKFDNDAQPTDLAAVVTAAGMSAVPNDPFGSAALRMTVVNGQTVIYSVGPDEVDDQAQVEWDPSVPQSKGDIVFRLLPTTERARPAARVARKWTDKAGAHSVVAELIEVKDSMVRLKRQDGKIVALPVEKLSDADRAYLKEHGHEGAVAP
jgi:hypothetical protein